MAQACPRKPVVRIQTHPRVRRNPAEGGKADDGIFTCQRNRDPIGGGDRRRTLGDQSQDFVQAEVFLGSYLRSAGMMLAAPCDGLFVHAGEGQQQLQGVMSLKGCG